MIDFNLGKPHSSNYNCFDHVRAFLANIGIDIKPIPAVFTFLEQKKVMLNLMASGDFQKVDLPQNGDIAVWPKIGHVGVYYDGMISHCPIYGSVLVEGLIDAEYWRPV